MMKRMIYTIGETVYDIIFENGNILAGKPGGSMLNASVTLGRMGYPVTFISELGNDDLGNLIHDFLGENNVVTDYMERFDEGTTPVALAFLDRNKNARYSFLKHYPDKRLRQPFPKVNENDIVLFGSFFSLSQPVRMKVINFVKEAKSAGAMVVYDPNIRRPHQSELPALLPMIAENFSLADIVRTSREDFETIYGKRNPEEAFEIVHKYSDAVVIFTRDDQPVALAAGNFRKEYYVPQVQVISTIGAGDTFNAAVAMSLTDLQMTSEKLRKASSGQWDEMIENGIRLSQQVCLTFDNYIGTEAGNV